MNSVILYILMGALFLFLAINSIEDTVWNVTTILLTAIAALDFGIAIRMIRNRLKHKQNK